MFENSCLEVCPFGYYADGDDNECKVCPPGCTECNWVSTGVIDCTTCTAPLYFLDGTSCISSAACSDTRQFKSTTQRKCVDCDIACATCYGPFSTNCTSC